ncbi:MAG: hypothetical protein U9Q30_09295 [Campylobacterota bacterium]|nr:hypothetical protein [Campylobacterota bacterium]
MNLDITTALQVIAFVVATFIALNVLHAIKLLITKSNLIESNKFAYNTNHNHARSSGISKDGKITHHKFSCGGASLMTNVIKDKSVKNSLVIKMNRSEDKYTFIPQTRLHGSGWFA